MKKVALITLIITPPLAVCVHHMLRQHSLQFPYDECCRQWPLPVQHLHHWQTEFLYCSSAVLNTQTNKHFLFKTLKLSQMLVPFAVNFLSIYSINDIKQTDC